ncbi:hypothetical protein SAMN04488055_5783 [Chitinophaga niabensis]|uniref:Uncharacterized protein n=1 Tax=Chitinophaga niabensis TaxID=536979 RepID=A0A1N6KG51_9BACT|nr:hypothetical protein SAMN04488055_5783 [Chitinophaga niabensis]
MKILLSLFLFLTHFRQDKLLLIQLLKQFSLSIVVKDGLVKQAG